MWFLASIVILYLNESFNQFMKKALVCGAGGFIGGHLVQRLKEEGYWVRGVDLKRHEYRPTAADEFYVGDLRKREVCEAMLAGEIDEVYQLAADMGGAGFVFTGENDFDIMHNSVMINLHMSELAPKMGVKKILYSSSACVYPEYNQMDPDNPLCSEESAYPAAPDSEYGWEKIFSERLYLSAQRNRGLQVRIARFHNIFGEYGTWNGGREKAPAAICRKIAAVPNGSEIEVWGDGNQTRSFLYISEAIDGVRRLMESDFIGPVNIGSEEKVSINQLVEMVKEIARKPLVTTKHIVGPLGVRGRNSHNQLVRERLSWEPHLPLQYGLEKTYQWIAAQVRDSGVHVNVSTNTHFDT